MAKSKIRKPKGGYTYKKLKCQNWDPENSKWGDFAPVDGCKEVVEVPEEVDKVLCWRCTMRSTQKA